MDMPGALRARITSANTSAGSRVYWVDRPQAAALPAVTLQIISDIRPQHLKGFDQTRDTRVQIDCWATSYSAVTVLKEAVLAAVVPVNTSNGIRFDRAIIDGERDLGERVETQFIHRASVDLVVWWATA
jgi:hypothetical protein